MSTAMTNTDQNPQRPWATPAVDIFENENAFLVRADLPGVTSAGVQVRFEQDSLRIEAARNIDDGTSSWNYDFRRVFKLSGIDEDHISAEMRDGVLSLTLPKAARLRPRQIPVNAG